MRTAEAFHKRQYVGNATVRSGRSDQSSPPTPKVTSGLLREGFRGPFAPSGVQRGTF